MLLKLPKMLLAEKFEKKQDIMLKIYCFLLNFIHLELLKDGLKLHEFILCNW